MRVGVHERLRLRREGLQALGHERPQLAEDAAVGSRHGFDGFQQIAVLLGRGVVGIPARSTRGEGVFQPGVAKVSRYGNLVQGAEGLTQEARGEGAGSERGG